jgi:hypothetical protein
MKIGNIFAMMLVVASAGGIAFAATSSEPILQVTNYTTTPSELYAGSLGYLQLTLSNTGDADAESATAYYTARGASQAVSVGSISAGSTARVSVPFEISQGAGGSIQLMTVDVYYTYKPSGSGTSSKKTSISVPMSVLQQNPLEARTSSIGSQSIAPGEKLSVGLELVNTGGVVNNLVITMPSNSSFSLYGTTQQAVGSIPQNSGKNITLVLASSSSTEIGTYSVPVVFTYQDSLKQPSEQILYVGPISVLDASTQYRLSLVPKETVEIGSQVKFKLGIENTGSIPMSATVDINSTDVFTPVGMQKAYFDSIPAGESAYMDVTIGVGSTASAGYYSLPLKLTTSTGQTATFNSGIAVEATPELTVRIDTQNSQIEIANTGNSQVRSVYASASSGAGATSESFVGTLSVDDTATLSLPTGASGSVNVEIRFRDSNNLEHIVKNTLQLQQGLGGNSTFRTGGAAGAGFAGNSSNSFANRGGNNPLGFLLGGGRAGQGTAQAAGINPVFLVAGGVVVIVVGYFAYRKWKGRKLQHQPPAEGNDAESKMGRKQK